MAKRIFFSFSMHSFHAILGECIFNTRSCKREVSVISYWDQFWNTYRQKSSLSSCPFQPNRINCLGYFSQFAASTDLLKHRF